MAKKLWGGRFKKKTNKAVEEFLSSLEYDKKLAEYDCRAGIAHAKMLAKTGVIKGKEKESIVKGLNSMLSDIKAGKLKFNAAYEDVHTYIQQALKKKIGPAADRLHIARSRNDLVSTETRMFCKDKIRNIIRLIKNLQGAMLYAAKKNIDIVMPGYTHMKHAEPVLFSHYILAYIEMLERDKERLQGAFARTDSSPLGAGAICGTALPVDRNMLAKELEFAGMAQNSIDAVSGRDFVVEILASLAIMAMHLSRLSEDFILFSSDEFGFIDIDEAFCTGSSMMPHKKNPDALELIRGESAEIFGNLVSSLAMMKGLPLSYNRDMQLDKKFLFNSVEIIEKELPILEELVKSLKINKEAIKNQLKDEFLYATDLAEFLMKKGVSHSEAHETVGKLVAYCLKNKKKISELSEGALKGFSKYFDTGIKKLINETISVKSKKSAGGTAPENVKKAIMTWEKRLR